MARRKGHKASSKRPLKKSKTSAELKIAAFLKEIEEPFRYSYDKITAEEEAQEIQRAEQAVAKLMEDDFDLNSDISTTSHKKYSVAQQVITGSVLHLAATFLRKYFLQVLLDKGADINKTDAEGHTALQVVVLRHYKTWTLHCARLLIDRGASLNVIDNQGRRLLDLCSLARKQNTKVLKLLIENGAKFDALEQPNPINVARRALQNKTYFSLFNMVSSENLNSVDEFNRTFVHYLSYYGFDLTSLLKDKVNVDILDTYGRLPLHYALLTGNLKNIEALKKFSSWNNEQIVDYIDNSGNNVLHFLLIGIVVYTCLKEKKIPSFPELSKIVVNFLSIVGFQKIKELVRSENLAKLTPIEHALKFIASPTAKAFSFPDSSPCLTTFVEKRNISLEYFNHLFLNLSKLLPEEYREDVETSILSRYYYFNPNIVKHFLLPSKDPLTTAIQYDFPNDSLAIKINKIVPAFLRNSSLNNALLYHFFVIKHMYQSVDSISYGMNYARHMVFNLFKGVMPGGGNLVYDIALLIASFLDLYTLNLVLPQVRKDCYAVSYPLHLGNLTLNNPENKETLSGQPAYNYLWNLFCKDILQTDQSVYDQNMDLAAYKQLVFPKIAFYLQCRGIDESYSYSVLESMCESYNIFQIRDLLGFEKLERTFKAIYYGFKNQKSNMKKSETILSDWKDSNATEIKILDQYLTKAFTQFTELQEASFLNLLENIQPQNTLPITISIEKQQGDDLGNAPKVTEDNLSLPKIDEEGDSALDILACQSWLNSPIFSSSFTNRSPRSPSNYYASSDDDTDNSPQFF